MSTKKAGAKGGEKTTSLTVRLDPKLKYGLEILSRKQHRNLSSTVEWALNMVLGNASDGLPYLEEIWDVDEADRLVKLALYSPELLTYGEQKIWKLIKESGLCWGMHYDCAGVCKWVTTNNNVDWKEIRDNWDIFVSVSRGDEDESKLPKWVDKRKVLDDEIPF